MKRKQIDVPSTNEKKKLRKINPVISVFNNRAGVGGLDINISTKPIIKPTIICKSYETDKMIFHNITLYNFSKLSSLLYKGSNNVKNFLNLKNNKFVAGVKNCDYVPGVNFVDCYGRFQQGRNRIVLSTYKTAEYFVEWMNEKYKKWNMDETSRLKYEKKLLLTQKSKHKKKIEELKEMNKCLGDRVKELEKKLKNIDNSSLLYVEELNNLIKHCLSKNMKNPEIFLKLKLEDWVGLAKKFCPQVFKFFFDCAFNEYDKKTKTTQDVKEFRAAMQVFLLARNRNSKMICLSSLFTLILKASRTTNSGINLLNQFVRICNSSTLMYKIMIPFVAKKQRDIESESEIYLFHWIIDNKALKMHRRREHIETLSRLGVKEGDAIKIDDVNNLRDINISLNVFDYYFSKDEEFTLESEGEYLNNNGDGMVQNQFKNFTINYDEKNKVCIIALDQLIYGKSSCYYDIFECLEDLNKRIKKGYLKVLTSDEQIIRACNSFQENGYFTEWVFLYGKLHGEMELSIVIMEFGFNFIFKNLAVYIGEKYITLDCKKIQYSSRFLVNACRAINLYIRDILFKKYNLQGTYLENIKFLESKFIYTDVDKSALDFKIVKLLCCRKLLNVFSGYYYKTRLNISTWKEERYFLNSLNLFGKIHYITMFFKALTQKKMIKKKNPVAFKYIEKFSSIQGKSKYKGHDQEVENFHLFITTNIANIINQKLCLI